MLDVVKEQMQYERPDFVFMSIHNEATMTAEVTTE